MQNVPIHVQYFNDAQMSNVQYYGLYRPAWQTQQIVALL